MSKNIIYDLLIDIDAQLSKDDRKMAKKNIVFLTTFLQFTEMDSCVYADSPYSNRCLEAVDEIWCWDILNKPETIPAIQTIFKAPIKCVPFIFTPIEGRETDKLVAEQIPDDVRWTVNILQKNLENTSSFLLRLVTVRELVNDNIINADFKLFNMSRIKDNKFMKENIYNNIELDKLPVEIREGVASLSS